MLKKEPVQTLYGFSNQIVPERVSRTGSVFPIFRRYKLIDKAVQSLYGLLLQSRPHSIPVLSTVLHKGLTTRDQKFSFWTQFLRLCVCQIEDSLTRISSVSQSDTCRTRPEILILDPISAFVRLPALKIHFRNIPLDQSRSILLPFQIPISGR